MQSDRWPVNNLIIRTFFRCSLVSEEVLRHHVDDDASDPASSPDMAPSCDSIALTCS